MGMAMAGMLASRLAFGNSRVWETLFAVAALWFVVRGALAFRGAVGGTRAAASHHVPYILASVAMLYMYLAPIAAASSSGGGAMSGMSDASDASTAASRYPLLGLVLAVSMVAYAVLIADRTPLAAPTLADSGGIGIGIGTGSGTTPRISAASAPCGQLAPRAANCCHIAMGVTMAYLLVVML